MIPTSTLNLVLGKDSQNSGTSLYKFDMKRVQSYIAAHYHRVIDGYRRERAFIARVIKFLFLEPSDKFS